jgi:hypothetical protein
LLRKNQTAPDWLTLQVSGRLQCLLRKDGIETWRLDGPIARSAGSEVFRLTCPGRKTLALKLCRDLLSGNPAPEIAREGFGALQRLHALTLTTAVLACPRPIGLIEDAGILLMEWVPGRPLADFLLWARASDAIGIGEQTGLWLAALQRPCCSFRVLPDIGYMLEQIAACRSGPVGDAAALLRKTAAGTFAEPVAWCRGYGDFKPRNLIVHGGRLVGIDPEMASEGPALADLAHFLNHLAALPLLHCRPGLRRAFADAVERGYEEGGMEIVVPQLVWLRVYNAIRLLESRSNWSRPPRSWGSRLILHRLITTLTHRLEQALRASR